MADQRQIAGNRKAFRDYHITDRLEAGIALLGSEVKSLRMGKANLKDAYATIVKDEVFLQHLHIGPYDKATIYNHDPLRTRKLLLKKREIKKLSMATLEKGLTIIPLSLYWKGNLVKVELALARGKRMYDKRDAIAKRDQARELDRVMKDHLKYRKR
ncbi:SsrA-binding protein SmpB [bacterium]|nr:SsrA-binding protein SmpB [bacterium]MBU1652786.1 SsrA-binding protein SmpB [bacterium]MBU1882004.1 SsrA-binding protein SmpB [bacterium]